METDPEGGLNTLAPMNTTYHWYELFTQTHSGKQMKHRPQSPMVGGDFSMLGYVPCPPKRLWIQHSTTNERCTMGNRAPNEGFENRGETSRCLYLLSNKAYSPICIHSL